ncbi:MAG: thioredoxin [Candidatus Levybacteria bacterium RIFCSPHIGHO2_01_FULL_40_10]|nr:MAG: thioredoxin [Candidatus Levybacteria bacterium RIFCSPHIGHO2_01_FULL_40_10]
MSVVTLSDSTFEQEVLKSDTPVLVDFWAEWCQPCKMVRPLVHELAEEYGDKIKVTEMDVDANPQVAGQFGVMSIPTIMIFKGGKPESTMIGVQPKETFKNNIDSALAS